jgi:hypothetical protein
MQVAGVKLLANGLELSAETETFVSISQFQNRMLKPYASSKSTSTFSLRGFPLAAMTS